MKQRHIAIDGDSASGKTTIGRMLADKLHFTFIDSGLFYRAATYIVIKNNAQNEKTKWSELITANKIILEDNSIYINEEYIEGKTLHTSDIDNLVSPVSTVPEIRNFITLILQEHANNKSVVMSGRDIGTVVLKDAFLKIYLTASIETRAERRFKELIKKGIKIPFEKVLENIKERDIIDSSRENAPLAIPEDAFVINTTALSQEEIIEKILLLMKSKEYVL